jgi:hypothetical protein
MDAKPAILERPAPAEQRIGADEAMHKSDSSIVTSATYWQWGYLNNHSRGHKEVRDELARSNCR